MKWSYLFELNAARARTFRNTPTDKPGAAPKGTLEEQLTQARADLAAAQGQVSSITAERDTATSRVTAVTAERDTLQGQFDSLTTSANELRTQLSTAQGQVTSLTVERDGLNAQLTSANTNVSRLEKLCGVKGVDPKSSVPAIDEPAAEVGEAQWIERYNSAKTPQDRAKVVDAMEAAAKARKASKA